jgi:hypothetical protein
MTGLLEEQTSVQTDRWALAIVELVLVQQQIREHDHKGLWDYHLPRVAASADRVAAVEAHLGEPLPEPYWQLLLHMDGWPAFYHTVDLFGTSDLLGSDAFREASETLELLIAEGAFEQREVTSSTLLPIAATREDLDLFVLARRASACPGGVIWLAGGEIQRWEDCYEFFLSMIEYNRLTLARMLREGA